MKKLLFIFALMVVSLASTGQTFVTIFPTNQHIGIAMADDDFYLRGRVGGTSFYDNIDGEYLKVSAGIRFKVYEDSDLLLGTAYNSIKVYYDRNPRVDLENIKKHSFEVGVIKKLNERVHVLFLTDLTNWETDLGVAYKF